MNLRTSYIKQIMSILYFHEVKDEMFHSTWLCLVEWNISSFTSWKYFYHCTYKHSFIYYMNLMPFAFCRLFHESWFSWRAITSKCSFLIYENSEKRWDIMFIADNVVGIFQKLEASLPSIKKTWKKFGSSQASVLTVKKKKKKKGNSKNYFKKWDFLFLYQKKKKKKKPQSIFKGTPCFFPCD